MSSNNSSNSSRSPEPGLQRLGVELSVETRVGHFREDVDHVWRVHVLLLVICATTVYLTAVSWTSTPEALPELKRFRRALNAIRNGSTDVEVVARFQPGLLSNSRQILASRIRSIDESIEVGRGVGRSTKGLLWINRLSGLQAKELSFDEEREALKKVSLQVRQLGPLPPATGLTAWVAKMRERGLERVKVHSLEADEPKEESVVVRVGLEATDRNGIQQKQQTDFDLEFDLRTEQAWSEGDFWSTFPGVRDWFQQSQLGGMTLSLAIATADDSLASELTDDLVLGPFRLQGEHLGVLGPCLVLLISAYIHLCARTLAERLEGFPRPVATYVQTNSRWLSMRIAKEARCAALFTDLGLSAVAVGLPVWRLTSQPLAVAVVLAAATAGIGWLTMALFWEPTKALPSSESSSASAEGMESGELRQLDLTPPRPEAGETVSGVGDGPTIERERENI